MLCVLASPLAAQGPTVESFRREPAVNVPSARTLPLGRRTVRTDTLPGAPGRDHHDFFRAITEVIGLNVGIWIFDAYIKDAEWASGVSLDTWKRNLEEGWQFDDNAFQANQFAHPYHGGIFFSAARASGYDFWESAPFAFFGSWTWEYFAEIYRPSFNDWINTSVGGMALGEMTWRLSELLIDEGDRGSSRIFREIGVAAINPARGFNRLIDGDWTEKGDYKAPRKPFNATLLAGARWIDNLQGDDDGQIQPVLRFVLNYGDPRSAYDGRPFDQFTLLMQLNGSDKETLGAVEATGRLWASRPGKSRWVINQTYVYDNYEAYEFGAQMASANWVREFGADSSWRFSAGLVGTILGAVSAENVLIPPLEEGYRDYDYGPGIGINLGLRRQAESGVSIYGNLLQSYLHAVNGSSGEHLLTRLDGVVSVPLSRKLTVNAGTTYFRRRSDYTGTYSDEKITEEALELRAGALLRL
jgi:hypothetical protein